MSRLNQLQDSVLRSLVQMRQSEAQDPLRNLSRYVQPALDMMELDRARKERDEQRAYGRARDAVADERYAREWEYQLEQDRSKRDWLELQRQDRLNQIAREELRLESQIGMQQGVRELDAITRGEKAKTEGIKAITALRAQGAKEDSQGASEFREAMTAATVRKQNQVKMSQVILQDPKDPSKLAPGPRANPLVAALVNSYNAATEPAEQQDLLELIKDQLPIIRSSVSASWEEVAGRPGTTDAATRKAVGFGLQQIGASGGVSEGQLSALRRSGATIKRENEAGGIEIEYEGKRVTGYPEELRQDATVFGPLKTIGDALSAIDRLNSEYTIPEQFGSDATRNHRTRLRQLLGKLNNGTFNDADVRQLAGLSEDILEIQSASTPRQTSQQIADAATVQISPHPTATTVVPLPGSPNPVTVPPSSPVAPSTILNNPGTTTSTEQSVPTTLLVPGGGNPVNEFDPLAERQLPTDVEDPTDIEERIQALTLPATFAELVSGSVREAPVREPRAFHGIEDHAKQLQGADLKWLN